MNGLKLWISDMYVSYNPEYGIAMQYCSAHLGRGTIWDVMDVFNKLDRHDPFVLLTLLSEKLTPQCWLDCYALLAGTEMAYCASRNDLCSHGATKVLDAIGRMAKAGDFA